MVRAHATVARYRGLKLSLRFLADAILRDCVTGRKIDHKAFAVYQKHLEQHRLDPGELHQMRQVFLAEMSRRDDPGYALAEMEIMEHLGIFI